jgi:eukaryotic-like serine/threonine-protein kinase
MNADDSNQDRFHVGSTVAGRYRVERPIGEGAMGAVALARHVSLDETVAIKFLRPELRRDPVANARLAREAKALARIKSDHVARVLDVGATLSVGPYMVMEYLEGTDLGEVLESEGPLPVARAVECVLQLCEALTVAHTAGITHRDIKPQNLFLARHGQFETLKILDFGIAEDAPPGGEPLASAAPAQTDLAGAPALASSALAPVYGTPSYMAPERVRNDPGADHRSDIWSVGVVLHELVTGRAVFDAPTITETCARIVSDAPLELEPNEHVLPPILRGIIARCLERDPERRYQNVEELTAALAPLGTMHERFRGRSTGAFSRRLLEELAQQAKTPQSGAGGAHAPVPSWLEVGAALRGRVGAARPLIWLRQRSIPTYAAVTAASALIAAIGLSLGGIHWMAPPPVTAMPLRAEPSRAAPRALRESVLQLGAPLTAELSPASPIESVASGEVAARGESTAEPPGGGDDAAVRPAERSRSSSARASQPEARKAARRAASPEPTIDTDAARAAASPSRVRLVEERVVTNRTAKAPSDGPRPGPAQASAAPAADALPPAKARPAPSRATTPRQEKAEKADAAKKARPLPSWLQTYQSKTP